MDGSFHCIWKGVFVNDGYTSLCSVYLEDTPVKSRAVLLLQVLVLVWDVENWQHLLLGYFPQLSEQGFPNTHIPCLWNYKKILELDMCYFIRRIANTTAIWWTVYTHI